MTFDKGVSHLYCNSTVESNENVFFRSMTENTRKRSREDDICEFMPLSKRINNLHINNCFTNQNVPQVQETSRINGIIENGISSSSSGLERRPSYDPGVNPSQSSYYNENKLLFELHLERMQRTGQHFPF